MMSITRSLARCVRAAGGIGRQVGRNSLLCILRAHRGRVRIGRLQIGLCLLLDHVGGNAGGLGERFRSVTGAAAGRRCDAAESGEAAANDTANRRGEQPYRQYRCDTPGHQAMQDAVETHLNAGKPGSDEAADTNGQATGEDPPNPSADPHRAGHWRAAGIGVDGVEANACTEQAEQKLKNDDEDDAADDRGPGYPAVDMRATSVRRDGLSRRRDGCWPIAKALEDKVISIPESRMPQRRPALTARCVLDLRGQRRRNRSRGAGGCRFTWHFLNLDFIATKRVLYGFNAIRHVLPQVDFLDDTCRFGHDRFLAHLGHFHDFVGEIPSSDRPRISHRMTLQGNGLVAEAHLFLHRCFDDETADARGCTADGALANCQGIFG